MTQYVLRCSHGTSAFTVVRGENFAPVIKQVIFDHWQRHACDCELAVSTNPIA
jgi:hypothetical protein